MQTIGKCCRGCVISRYCIRRILATITDISYLYCCTDVELFAGFQLIFERMDIWQGSAGSFMALASVSQRLRNTSHGFSRFSHRVWSALWFHTTSCRITYHPDQWQCQPEVAELQKRANRANQLVLFFLAGANFWEKHAKTGENTRKQAKNRRFFGANFLGGKIGRC